MHAARHTHTLQSPNYAELILLKHLEPERLLINWQEQYNTKMPGLVVNSPASGMILPLHAHTDPLYNTTVLPQALCIKLQHDTLIAPFAGIYDRSLLGGRRLNFRHKSGLTLQLDLPEDNSLKHGEVIKPLVHDGAPVIAGQPVLRLDPKLLQADMGYLIVLMVLPHPAISAVFSAERVVTAGQDAVFTLQMKNK